VPLVWYEGAGTTDRRWFHADERGSVIAVSNSAGSVIALNSYDEYGIPQSTNQGRFQYCIITKPGCTPRRWAGSCRVIPLGTAMG
jgi:hypothetical protein